MFLGLGLFIGLILVVWFCFLFFFLLLFCWYSQLGYCVLLFSCMWLIGLVRVVEFVCFRYVGEIQVLVLPSVIGVTRVCVCCFQSVGLVVNQVGRVDFSVRLINCYHLCYGKYKRAWFVLCLEGQLLVVGFVMPL